MHPRNQNLSRTVGIKVFRFEMIAKDCDITQRDFQTWGLNPSEGKRHILFLTDTEQKIKEYIILLELNSIQYELKDITDSVITMTDVDPLLLRAYTYNPKFKNIIDNFRSENLSVDDVLDKVSQFGQSSLDEVELQVLKNI
jgi:hypothetical protein